MKKQRLNPYSFAEEYSALDLATDSPKRDEFIRRLLLAEAPFFKEGIFTHHTTGLTHVGISIDPYTGQLLQNPRNWSAASKESNHLTLLCLSLSGDGRAQALVSRKSSLEIIKKKMTSYEKFDREYPGFGGFLPWFLITENGILPTPEWQNRVPGLDNGQWMWALFLTSYVLKQQGMRILAGRYLKYWQKLARNSVMVFLENSQHKIRVEARVHDPKAFPTPSNYSDNLAGYYLDDPYEGELLMMFMTLFSPSLSDLEKQMLWENRTMPVATYMTKNNEGITVEKGYWYSSHEKWKYFVLPYLDIPRAKQMFLNGEKARTWYSAENHIPGLFSSTHAPLGENQFIYYRDGLGVPSLASQPIVRSDIVTPYAAFPVMLADIKTGLLWLWNMISAPKMQGPYGITESILTNGKAIAPVLTCDGKILPLLGGILGQASISLMRKALLQFEVYDVFKVLVTAEYEKVFTKEKPEGFSLPFRLPTQAIPQGMEDFQAYSIPSMKKEPLYSLVT